MAEPDLPEVPFSFKTARLRIRSPSPGDGPAVHAAVLESLAELRAWGDSLPWAMSPPSVDASERFCREGQANYASRRVLPMLLFAQDTGLFVGASGLHGIDWALRRFEIGYWCRTNQTGRGLITEAVVGITGLAFEVLGARRIECRTDAQNLRSRRVCEKAGYALETIYTAAPKGEVAAPGKTCLYARDSPVHLR
jgi:RimJ/RimL family protein N-acetyltransferase